MLNSIRHPWLVAALVGVLIHVAMPAAAQTSKSSSLAQELSQLMSSHKLDSVAAKSAAGEDRFVAALFFPGQLLVVSARYEVPMYVERKLENEQYREVYIDLNAASIAGSKVLVTDGGANGLMATRIENVAFDIWDNGTKMVRFDGQWRDQQMSEEDYLKVFAESDAQYAEMLEALIGELK